MHPKITLSNIPESKPFQVLIKKKIKHVYNYFKKTPRTLHLSGSFQFRSLLNISRCQHGRIIIFLDNDFCRGKKNTIFWQHDMSWQKVHFQLTEQRSPESAFSCRIHDRLMIFSLRFQNNFKCSSLWGTRLQHVPLRDVSTRTCCFAMIPNTFSWWNNVKAVFLYIYIYENNDFCGFVFFLSMFCLFLFFFVLIENIMRGGNELKPPKAESQPNTRGVRGHAPPEKFEI